jgi:carboxylesterase
MANDVMAGCEPFSATGSRQGVLVLHGFTGNPQSMRPLAEVLADAGYSVELPRLPGHGTSLEDMMTTSWDDWSATAADSYDELDARCDQVAIAGLSMGGALACSVAESRLNVAGLVLINPLVKAPPREMLDGLDQLIDSGVETIDAIGSDIKKDGSKEFSYPATPLRSAKSLFAGVEGVHKGLSLITAPILLLSSREDHVVTSDNGDELERSSGGAVERVWLEDSYHVATLDNDAGLIESLSLGFLAGVFSR